MAITVKEIRELKEYYVGKLYTQTRKEQKTDYDFYTDIFTVPWIKSPLTVSRTGAGAELIDEPVEQLSATRLIVSRLPLKETITAKESAIKISKLINETWIRQLMKQNPNPRKESFKNIFIRGENWKQVVHNPRWVLPPYEKNGLPVFFLMRDPLIVYASPNENEEGIPENIIIFYERMPWVVQKLYPEWSNPKRAGESNGEETVTWLEYWDKDIRYFEADEEPVLDISPNPYEFVPFVHKVSGFGKSSAEGKPEELVVGRLRRYRDLLKRNAAITSDIDSSMHLFANPTLEVQGDDVHEVPEKFDEVYSFAPGVINKLPPGITVKRGVDLLPAPEVLQWAYVIEGTLGRKMPSVLSGAPQGETGRLQDITYSTAMRKWEGIVQGEQDSWATALGMALRMCDEMPELLPDGISHADIGKNYTIEVELKLDDPLDSARKSADGDRKQSTGIIDWETNLVKYQGFTVEEAHAIMDNAVVDRIMLTNPDIQQIMAMNVTKEMGMEQEFMAIQQARMAQGGIGSRGGPPREGNIQTELGAEQIDLSQERRPIRRSPGG